MSSRNWTWLIDDYEKGTVFVTDDATGDQYPLVSGITKAEARQIIAALEEEHASGYDHACEQAEF